MHDPESSRIVAFATRESLIEHHLLRLTNAAQLFLRTPVVGVNLHQPLAVSDPDLSF